MEIDIDKPEKRDYIVYALQSRDLCVKCLTDGELLSERKVNLAV